jgi:hypothetical protein
MLLSMRLAFTLLANGLLTRMCDAQPQVAHERVHAVIPPAKDSSGCSNMRKLSLKPRASSDRNARARFAEQHFAFPQPGIVHVALFGCDVVVAEQREPRIHLQLLREPLVQPAEPGQLVAVLVRPRRSPLGTYAQITLTPSQSAARAVASREAGYRASLIQGSHARRGWLRRCKSSVPENSA